MISEKRIPVLEVSVNSSTNNVFFAIKQSTVLSKSQSNFSHFEKEDVEKEDFWKEINA